MKKISSIIYYIIVSILVIAIGIIGFFVYRKMTYYTFELEGEKEIVLFNEDEYLEQGYSLLDCDNKDMSGKVEVKNNIDSKQGEYYVKYYFRGKLVGERKIIVKNITFKINGEENVIIDVNEQEPKYEDEGFIALDANGNDYSDHVEVIGEVKEEIGTYEIKYKLSVDNYEKILTRKVEIGKYVKQITLDKEEITLGVNDSDVITATIEPIDASNSDLVWESSDEQIVTVENGEIKGVSEGEAIITVRSSNLIEVSCKVTVTKKDDEITVENVRVTHTGSQVDAKVKVKSEEQYVVTYYTDSSCTTKTTSANAISDGGSPKEIGIYYVIVETVGNKEYNSKKTNCTKAVQITKTPARVKVGTLNMGVFKCGSSKITCSPTWKDFANVFRNSGVDIVGIQEGSQGSGALHDAGTKGGLGNIYTEAPSSRLGILSKYAFVSKDYKRLTSCIYGHGIIKTVVNINGVNISFYDTHLCWNLTNKACSDIHFQEVANIVKSDPNPAIVVADFNVTVRTNFDRFFAPIGGVIAAYDTSTNNMWNSNSYCDSVVIFPRDHISTVNSETYITYKKQSDHNLVLATLEIY